MYETEAKPKNKQTNKQTNKNKAKNKQSKPNKQTKDSYMYHLFIWKLCPT